MKRAILPTIGACAVFTIDPVASLDPGIQDDPHTIVACKSLAAKKYAVLVTGREGLYAPWNSYNVSIVHFIQQGEPRPDPEKCMEPSMSLPILPMTTEAHPSSRDPLKPSNPLPWNDCYISCFSHATLRSATLFTTEPILHIIDSEQLIKGDSLLAADVERQKYLARIKDSAQSVPPTSPTAGESPSLFQIGDQEPRLRAPRRDKPTSMSGEFETSSRKYQLTTESGDEDEYDDARNSSDESDMHDMPANLPPQVIITVNFSHDLSDMDVLSDPADYFKEVEAITRIQEEAWPRVTKAKAQATKDVIKEAACSSLRRSYRHTIG